MTFHWRTTWTTMLPRMLLTASFILMACTYAPDRYAPGYPTYRESIHTVLLLNPEIGIFQEMPDGSFLWQDAGSREAQRNACDAVTQIMVSKGFNVLPADSTATHDPEIVDVRRLFRSVNRSIQLHTYGPQIFPAKQSRFEYSLGSVENLLRGYGADGLVLVIGRQDISVRAPKTWVSIAVVERGGAIIWYSMQGGNKDMGLQTQNGTLALIHQAFMSLAEAGS